MHSSLKFIALALSLPFALIVSSRAADTATSESEQADLVKKTLNPVADLISVPFQNNWDFGIGKKDGMKFTCNIQPVIPVTITKDWNVIIRTIMPVIYQEEIIPDVNNSTVPPKLDWDTDQSGLGDITQSFFLSPKEPVGGWILGAGPAFLYPSATDDRLGSEKWGAGPTAVVLQQKHGWTYGMLANHIWSFVGNNDRASVNATYLQPFVSYSTKTFTSFGVDAEATYNWQATEWTVPLNFTVTQLLKVGKLPISLQFGPRYYAHVPEGGPDWGLRFAVTLLFPEK